MTPPGSYSAFVSYASENREKADIICAALEQRGFVCWIAPRDVRAGREYADEIIQGLERSAAVVLVLSEAANTSVFVLREVERAVSKEINVIPVRIEEITPSPGLELFISGTHWLDAFDGDWDEHMNRLARDLGDDATPVSVSATDRRSFAPRPSLGRVYAAAALLVGAVLGGFALWSFSGAPSVEPSVSQDNAAPGTARPTAPAIPPEPSQRDTAATRQVDASPSGVAPPPERVAPTTTATRSTRPADDDRGGPRAGPPTSEPVTDRRPATVPASGELNALTEDYDELSLRGGVIDDALNVLWEQMKPNSPRLDMVTHQRSLRMSLTRSKDALADMNTAAARRYLNVVRSDLAALEEFLNR
jgi:hypothetical protein